MTRIAVLTHRQPVETAETLETLAREARAAGATLCFDAEETRKHGLERAEGIEVDAPVEEVVDLCIVLGGDGTILRALQRYVGTDVPVFAINFGEIGFLATVEQSDSEEGIHRALAKDFELLRLPAIVIEGPPRARRRTGAAVGSAAQRAARGARSAGRDQRRRDPSQGR